MSRAKQKPAGYGSGYGQLALPFIVFDLPHSLSIPPSAFSGPMRRARPRLTIRAMQGGQATVPIRAAIGRDERAGFSGREELHRGAADRPFFSGGVKGGR
jgi:hypothetical protein